MGEAAKSPLLARLISILETCSARRRKAAILSPRSLALDVTLSTTGGKRLVSGDRIFDKDYLVAAERIDIIPFVAQSQLIYPSQPIRTQTSF
jgi:hypothetical protein